MADPHEAFGQHMQHEAAHDLGAIEAQRMSPSFVAIILGAERDFGIIDRDEAGVAYGDTVRVVREANQEGESGHPSFQAGEQDSGRPGAIGRLVRDTGSSSTALEEIR